MGFLDNFKAAMKAGSEAANADIERQRVFNKWYNTRVLLVPNRRN